jgi:hypothetical protein
MNRAISALKWSLTAGSASPVSTNPRALARAGPASSAAAALPFPCHHTARVPAPGDGQGHQGAGRGTR